jgi:AcrR family transcriptional regulator
MYVIVAPEEEQPLPTQSERTAVTRDALLDAAGAIAFDRGFAHASLEDICARAGVTRGALYHHFADKAAVFEALVMRAQAQIAAEIDRTVPLSLPAADQLKESCATFVRMMSARPLNAVLVKEAPAILGVERWRQLEHEYAIAALQQAIEAARAERPTLPSPSSHLAARMLLGALNEAALAVAGKRRAANDARALADRIVDAIL